MTNNKAELHMADWFNKTGVFQVKYDLLEKERAN